MKSATTIAPFTTTAAQVAENLTPNQVIIYLLVVIVLVLLGMVWKAWSHQFPPPPPPPSKQLGCRTRTRGSKRT
jgi:hypothetical protein